MSNKTMKTLTIAGSTYEIYDEVARTSIAELKENIQNLENNKFDVDDIDATLTITGKIADAKATGDALNTKINLDGSNITNDLNLNNKKIVNIGTPTEDTDAANMLYVKEQNTILKTQFDSLAEKSNVNAYTSPVQFGCSVDATPKEICSALPNGSIFLCSQEILTNEAWNFPMTEYGLVQILKGTAITDNDTGFNSARIRTMIFGKGISHGADYLADVDENGIPTGTWYKIPKMLPTTVTLSVANWSNLQQTVSANGVTTDNTIIVSPVSSSYITYITENIRCTAQGSGTLTFTCDYTPTVAVVVNVMILT